MPSFYPPVLENKAQAIPFIANPESTDFFDIIFAMPSINVLTDIGHIQVSIKYQSTAESAVNPQFSPDRAVLYIERSEGAAYFVRLEGGNYMIRVPYRCFAGGRPEQGTTYTVQVRFGSNMLWDPATNGLDGIGFGAFAAWRNQSTNQVPSAFGEWSNMQTVYCYGEAAEELTYNLDDFIPEIVYSYAPSLDDPLEQCKIVYQYADMYGSRYNTLVFNGQYQQDGSYVMRAKLPIAPVQTIYISLEAITKNNTIRGGILTIFPLKNTLEIPSLGGDMKNAELIGEENNDGALAKTIILKNQVSEGSTLNFYRSNVYTLETVKVIENYPIDNVNEITVKDYSVEMGEDYQYIATIVDRDKKIVGTVISPYEWGYENKGYARLMNMDAIIFLTTRDHQLRLQGAVNVSALKRNTQDNFQTTIGSKYPFYSRNGQMNYRTFTLNAFISIAFDPTGTFLRNDSENGLWWDNENGSKLVILNRDLYGESQHSLSRRRTKELASERNHKIDQPGVENARDVFGPMTIYDPYYFRNIITNIGEMKTSEAIYLERKFRDFVMEWLSNGKPKLFRSETEGNMIVMISGVNLTPQQGAGRQTYSMSCTVTEIAEYNLENLLLYNLIPYDITANLVTGFPKRVKIGDIISEQDYLTILVYAPYMEYVADPDHGNYFSPYGNEWMVSGGVDEINKILSKITEYSFIRGDEDPYVYAGLIYQFNKIYNIPNSISGQEIKSIDTSTALRNIPDAIKNDDGTIMYPHPIFEVSSGTLPKDLSLDPYTGIISGTPVWTNYDAPRPKDTITLKCHINYYDTPTLNFDPLKGPVSVLLKENVDSAEMVINVGYIYSELLFNLDSNGDGQSDITIPVSMIGKQITPVDLSRYVKGGVKFFQLEDADTKQAYLWSAVGLPAGLSISDKGVISGAYLSPVTGGVATIYVTDGVGQVKAQNLSYGNGVQQIFFQDSLKYNLTYSEVGVEIDPVDVHNGVTGGYKSTNTTDWPTGYEFSATGLPPGIDIDPKTGIIQGTPTQQVPAGVATITATDFGPTRTSASIEIVYQEVLAPFAFTDDISYDINPYNDYTPMNLGLVITPIDLMKENFEAVTGGLKYNDPPYYRFTSKNLIPDFSIDNYGVISGRASVANEQRTATIIVYDARGEQRSIEITIVGIISKLSFRPPSQLTIPSTFVNQPTPIKTINIPYSWIDGGTPKLEDGKAPYKITISGLPNGIDGQEKKAPDGTWYFEISGTPTTPVESHDAILTISDYSPEVETIIYKIPVGQVVGELTWNQPQINLMDYGVADGERIPNIYVAYVSGGKPPYTLRVDPDKDFYPLVIYQSEGGEQVATEIYIGGTMSKDLEGKNFHLYLTDASGQTVSNILQVGNVQNALSLQLLNPLGNFTLIEDYSEITDLLIMKASGGDGNYKYYAGNTISDYPFDTGVALNHDTGTISGVVQTPSTPSVNIGSTYFVQDTSDHQSSSSDIWTTPIVISAPKLAAGISGTVKIPMMRIDDTVNMQLINFGNFPGTEWIVTGTLPGGLTWANGKLSGTCEEYYEKATVTLTMRVPYTEHINGTEGSVITPQIDGPVIQVTFEGVTDTMRIDRPDGIDYEYMEVGVPIQEKAVNTQLRGGTPPYKWALEGEPEGISLNATTTQSASQEIKLTGTPTKTSNSINVKVICTDSAGNSKNFTFAIKGIFEPLVVTDSPAYDIPNQASSQDIAEIDLSKAVSGGTPPYNYAALDSIQPYTLNSTTGIINGNSGTLAFPARTARIRIFSNNNIQYKDLEIAIGEIQGELNYIHQDAHDIPNGLPNTAGTVNISTGVYGGASPKYSIVSRPDGWTDTNIWIANENQGTINYKYPATVGTKGGTCQISIADGSGSRTITAEISVGNVVESIE